MKILVCLICIFIFLGCNSDKRNTPVSGDKPGSSLQFFGEAIDTSASNSVNATLEALKSKDSLQTKVTGYVTGVCKVKGCWMMISQHATDTSGLFVKFKNYGFFVPKDLTGSKVTVAGVAFKSVTPVDELKHYAEDEGKSAEEIAKIDKPSEELKFMASGVALIEKAK